ncbi:MAG: extracellular solute-binding protein [Treponema sp.]|nr:extracellular solute-binding protein [Treponema sp.]
MKTDKKALFSTAFTAFAVWAFIILITALTASGCARGKKAGETSEPRAMGPTGTVEYPIDTDITLTYWVELSSNMRANYTTMAETPYGKGLMEKTGIKIKYIHPPAGTANEQFNLMIASGDLPDIIERNWSLYPGGLEKAISDGVLIKLNDLFAGYSPNLTEYLKENTDFDRMIKLDNGTYIIYPFIRGDPELLAGNGLMIRRDWLDDLGLQMPTTIDEWHTVLKAFKDKKNSKAPLSFEYQSYMGWLGFINAYDVMKGLYVGNDGKAHFGQIENGYRDFLTTFSQWYREGLVDPDLPTLQQQQVAAKITGGIAGASCGALGSRMGAWIPAGRATNPRFNLVAAPIPVLVKGDKPQFVPGMMGAGSTGAAITTACKYPDIAARLLDWGYSPEGFLYNNFGTEGVSYRMENGNPVFTDEIMKNPKGWPPAQALAAYARSQEAGPFVQDIRYYEQYMSLPEQKDALKTWTSDRISKNSLPPTTPTQEEAIQYARIMNEINTYVSEMEVKFIIGTESMGSWNNYVATVKRMGIDKALEIQNAALERYRAR